MGSGTCKLWYCVLRESFHGLYSITNWFRRWKRHADHCEEQIPWSSMNITWSCRKPASAPAANERMTCILCLNVQSRSLKVHRWSFLFIPHQIKHCSLTSGRYLGTKIVKKCSVKSTEARSNKTCKEQDIKTGMRTNRVPPFFRTLRAEHNRAADCSLSFSENSTRHKDALVGKVCTQWHKCFSILFTTL